MRFQGADVTTEERFWAKVEKTDGCWNWTAAKKGLGYGQFWAPPRLVLAHRYVFELLVGPIPDGMEIDHLCRNPSCVNPAHLEAVTPQLNQWRGTSPAGVNHLKTHCVKGHLLPSEPNRVSRRASGHGWRTCKVCVAERGRAYHAANRERLLAENRAWRMAHRDELAARSRERRLKATA